MLIINVFGNILALCAGIYLLVLIIRMIIDWIRFFIPTWRPGGLVLIVANFINAITNPPLRWLRRYIPPLRLGSGVALDVGFMILFGCVIIVESLGNVLARW